MLLTSLAFAAPHCGTPDALRTDPHARVAPGRLGVGRTLSASGKAIYGGTYASHHDSTNFTVNDPSGTADPALLQTTAEALEVAWTRFLVDMPWRQPVSTDTYKVWILLDTSLGGTTGYTTEYTTDEYPQGYPVIYLNPDYAYDTAFWDALVAHEFMHAIQYAYRDYDYSDTDETWFWEACAMWAEEQALPDNDAYAVHARWYTTQTELRYSSTENSHAYGMFVLPAYVEEQVGDADSMRHMWETAEPRVGDAWSDIVADTVGVDVEALWAGFTAAVGGKGLRESSKYQPVEAVGVLADGADGTLDLLGSDYYTVRSAAVVTVDSGDVFLSASGGAGDSVVVAPGDVLAVTARADGAAYVLAVADDTGDTGDTADTGDSGVDTDPGDTADTGGGGDSEDTGGVVEETGKEEPGGCGCATGGGGGVAGFAALGALALLISRRR